MRHTCLSLTAVIALVAGEAPPPAIILTAPDAGRSAERLLAGPYGKIWQQPAVQKLRTELTALPGADPAWMGMVERVREVRFELAMPTGKAMAGTKPEPIPRLALRLPAGQDPAVPTGSAMRREGDWLLLGAEGSALAVPAAHGPAEADLSVGIDLAAFAVLMPEADAATYRKVLGILGFGRIDIRAEAFPGGVREQALVAGCKLPLRAADTAALAGFPVRPIGILAVGIDGKALLRQVHAIADQTGGSGGLQRGDAEMKAALGIGLDDLLAGFDGTVVIASTPGVPFPGMTLSVPANAATDALVSALFERLEPGSGVRVLAQAKTQAIMIPLPPNIPLPVVVRRSATSWVVSTDQLLIDTLCADKPAPFPVEQVWPKSAGAVGLAWGDTRAQVQTLIGVLPMAMARVRDPEAKKWATLVQGALVAALPHLQPSVLVARNRPDGLHVAGENGLIADVMPVSVLAGMMLPAINLVRENAQRTKAASNMRGITVSAIAYTMDFDGRYPLNLAELQKWSDGDLTDEMLRCPGRPEIAQPFLYVRPVPSAKAMQPVIVQDPACNRGAGSLVCYADGHIAYIKGAEAQALWVEAKRLAILPQAALMNGGIKPSDWTTVPELKAKAPAASPEF